MPNKSFIKLLLERRIPQILSSYLITGTSLILFIEYLVGKYHFPSHYPTLALFSLIGILPSVVILSYFHGAPGKDEWSKVEKFGIPFNVFFIAVILFFGDSLNIWKINNPKDSKHTVSLIHFTSLPEHIPHITEYLTLESDNVLYPIDKGLLDSLRTHFSVQLLNWYFGQDKEFFIPRSDKDVNYLNNHPLLSVDLKFTEDRSEDVESWKKSADSIYANFNKPDHISYLNIYKISLDIGEPQYIITESYLRGNPNFGQNGDSNPTVKSISKLFDEIKGSIDQLLGSTKNIGIVSEINDDIIMVNVKDKNVRKDMELLGTSTYNFAPGNNGYSNRLEDLKNALDYMNETNEYDDMLIQSYRKKYDSLLGDSLYCRSYDKEGVYIGGCVQTRGQNYYLRVINVIDSIAVTKIIKYRYPWVQARINDGVFVLTN